MRTLVALLVLLPSSACSAPYYWTMERFGVEKREILVDRVEQARDAQGAAKEQFADALEAFRAVTGFRGESGLEALYARLSKEYESSKDRAETVSSRIRSVETVANDLFGEWEDEIDVMSSPDLRARSSDLLAATRERFDDLAAAMRRAEASMQPVLTSLRDHVLALKHDLNAQAVASLSGELTRVEGDVAALVADMEAAIAEADAFLATMGE